MPTSRPDNLSYICNMILSLQPKSILDIGCGFGSKGVLFREYTDIWQQHYAKNSWNINIEAIEVHEQYITELHHYIYDKIYIGEAIMTLKNINKVYDFIYAGDILEHFDKEQGVIFLELLYKLGKDIIISTPINVSHQGVVMGNVYETHRSSWQQQDFKNVYSYNTFNNLLLVHIKNEKI